MSTCRESCPVCAAASHTDGALARRCVGCGLQFAERMDQGDAPWYEESAVYGRRHDVAAPPPLRRLDWAQTRFFALCPTPGAVLDLGCSSGDFLAHAAARGWVVRGRELTRSGVALARARHGEGAIEAAEASAAWPAEVLGTQDAATAFELLEHLADPLGALRQLVRVLRSGGRVVISVPRLDRRPALFDPVIDAPPHHLTLWTRAACTQLLERAGLAQVVVEARALRPQDFYLHHTWRRERQGRGRGPRAVDRALRARCLASVALRRTLGLAAGHTLLATGVRPGDRGRP